MVKLSATPCQRFTALRDCATALVSRHQGTSGNRRRRTNPTGIGMGSWRFGGSSRPSKSSAWSVAKSANTPPHAARGLS